jgi:hypothetical protein
MVKWRLMLTTLPFVFVLVAIKLGMNVGLNFDGMIEFSSIAVILTGGIFLIGFMLAGTMTDYKESEKFPGEIACSLEAIEEGLSHIAAAKQNVQVSETRTWIKELADTLNDWFYKKVKTDTVYDMLSQISRKAQPLDSTALAVRVQNELHALRKIVTRIEVISRTSFIQSGYALLDTIVVLVLLLLMVSKFDSILSEAIVTSFVSMIYIYMVRLIRDIDDPFEYEEGKEKGSAEVALFPLDEFRQRIQNRISL